MSGDFEQGADSGHDVGAGAASGDSGSPVASEAGSASTPAPESPRGVPNGHAAPPRYDTPPQAWAREHHIHWNTIPEALRPYLHQRESEAQKRIGELGVSAKAAKEFADAFTRIGTQLPQNVSQAQYVLALLAAERGLAENPKQAFAHLAKHYGVNLRELVGDDGYAARLHDLTGRHAQAESAVRHLMGEVDRLQAELAQRNERDQRAKADQEKQIKEAKRHQALNMRGAISASRPKETMEETLRREVNRRISAR